MSASDCVAYIEELTSQVEELYKAVNKSNKHFWKALLDPSRHLMARPEMYSSGSVEEMQLVLQYTIESWNGTPGALEVIRAKVGG